MFEDRVVHTDLEGWQSACEVWHLERIPIIPQNMQTMVACVAPLGRRAHRNPLRAALGEFEFYNRKEFAKRTERVHEDKVQTRAIADFKDAEDYNNAKENMKRAIEKVDTS